MDVENKHGKMEASLRATGKMEQSMDKEDLSMPWVMFTKVNGKMIWPMDSDVILIAKVQSMRETSLRICSMAMGRNNGRMERCIRVITKQEEEMAMENLYSQINLNIWAILAMIIFTVKVHMIGPMAENTKANGL